MLSAKIKKAVVAAAIAIAALGGAAGSVGAQPVSGSGKLGCSHDGKDYSHGSTRPGEYVSTNSDGSKNYQKFECVDGVWVQRSCCYTVGIRATATPAPTRYSTTSGTTYTYR